MKPESWRLPAQRYRGAAPNVAIVWRPRAHVYFTALLALILACDTAPRDASRRDARDTVTDAPWSDAFADSIPVWRVADTPELILGDSESVPEEIFHEVRSVLVHSSGDVIVADRGSSQVRVFDGRGRFRGSFGSPGGGPREFAMLEHVGSYAGDSIYTFDPIAQRIAIWSLPGDLGRTFFPPRDLGPRFRSAYLTEEDEFIVVSNTGPMIVPPGESRSLDSLRVAVVTTTGELITELTRVPSAEIRVVPTPDGGDLHSLLIFGPEGEYAARSNCLDYGWSAEWTVIRFCSRGSEVDTLRFELPLRPLTDAVFDAWLEDWLDRRHGGAGPSERSRHRRYFRTTWPPILRETLPAFDRMVSDDEGHLWLRRYRLLDEPDAEWVIISDEGTIVARTTMNGSFEPMHIATDRIAGMRRDALDREQVVIVPLERNAQLEP